MNISIFLKILDLSIKRNGPDKPLTLGHLRNLIALAQEKSELIENSREEYLDSLSAAEGFDF